MKRLFGIMLVVGLVAVGAVAWAQDSPPVEVRAASQATEPFVAVPVTEGSAINVAPDPPAELQNPQSASEDSPISEVSEKAPAAAAEERPIVWPVPEAPPAPPEGRTVCEIVHADGPTGDFWAVYGTTTLQRGTVFLFTLEYDGTSQTVPLVAQAGGIVINGTRYGPVDGYTDDGTTNFGNTSADMPKLPLGHGPVVARVTLGGITHCSA